MTRMRWFTRAAIAVIFGLTANAMQDDKYIWLEDVWGARSMAWVKAENERSAKVLENDPRFASLQASALKVLESKDRLATPEVIGNDVFNIWQDANHVRGILRRTTVEDYLTAEPHWRTVVDYDALGKQDQQSWVAKGLNCLSPGNDLCFIDLSAGGEDAITMREFSLKENSFISDGFALPKSKQSVAWLDRDTLLVARDWGAGTMTKSGYAFVVKMWKRGQPLDQAKEIFRGTVDDVWARPSHLTDSSGHSLTLLSRGLDFFRTEWSFLSPAGPKKLALPSQSQIEGLFDGQLIVMLNEDWQPAGGTAKFSQGTIVSLDLEALKADPAHLKPKTLFAPSATEFAQHVAATKDRLLVTTLDHVQGRVYTYRREPNGNWARTRLPLPDNRAIEIASADRSSPHFFLSVTGFLNPSALWHGSGDTVKEAKSLPAQFDASALTVEQLEAVSKDGTKVPYFVVRPKNVRYDGNNPTLLTAYGGFQISRTPTYEATLGKLWLERGGVYVLANIRGGGEFGPAWHQAGLKTHRQRIYDDFAAVGADLVKRRITSPKHLGISGGSNGGLQVGVQMTQHPEMWNAVVIQIPLLDMLRFEQIAAGASWVGEYGSVSVPEERAFLASISPYNQLKPNVNYPEPLIFTTTKDDRVGPVHARKFAAKMAEFGKPYFYEEITEGGHGAGADLKEKAKTYAVQYTYLSRKLMGEPQ